MTKKIIKSVWLWAFFVYLSLSLFAGSELLFFSFFIGEIVLFAKINGIRINKVDEWRNFLLKSYEDVKKAKTIQDFIVNWELVKQSQIAIQKYDGKVIGRQSAIKKIKELNLTTSSEEYQWLLRNAIERQASKVMLDIKTTYKNSATYKQEAYNAFYREASEHQDLYNDETASFTNSLLDDLSYVVTGERRISQSVVHSAAHERSLMSASLRYDIMKRDGFKCTLCGRSQADGVKLHVDHIQPVSKGGLTTPSNLRTLCQDCNLGKSDKYDESGEN